MGILKARMALNLRINPGYQEIARKHPKYRLKTLKKNNPLQILEQHSFLQVKISSNPRKANVLKIFQLPSLAIEHSLFLPVNSRHPANHLKRVKNSRMFPKATKSYRLMKNWNYCVKP